MKLLIMACCFSASACLAQDYETRSNDVRLDDAALSALILDRDLEYFDGGVSHYATGGTYRWTYAPENGGGIWQGTYVMASDGRVCIDFETLRSRCDLFVQSGDRLVLLTEDGQRFPLRDMR